MTCRPNPSRCSWPVGYPHPRDWEWPPGFGLSWCCHPDAVDLNGELFICNLPHTNCIRESRSESYWLPEKFCPSTRCFFTTCLLELAGIGTLYLYWEAKCLRWIIYSNPWLSQFSIRFSSCSWLSWSSWFWGPYYWHHWCWPWSGWALDFGFHQGYWSPICWICMIYGFWLLCCWWPLVTGSALPSSYQSTLFVLPF